MRRLTLGAMICLVSGLSLSIASEPGRKMAESNTGVQVTHILEVTPDTLYDTLLTGATSSQNITITNLGTATQTFDVTVDYLRPSNPLPLASWPTVRLPLIEDFEDGDYEGWSNYGSSTGVREVTDSTAAEGLRSFHSSNNSFFFEFHEGIIYKFDVGSQISRMSFYVRSNSADRNDAFVTVYSDSTGTVVSFLANKDGVFTVNVNQNGDASYTYTALTWYLIEFLNFDWEQKNFDYFVNGELVKADIGFRSSGADNVGGVILYNLESGTEAWWDEVRIGGPDWLAVQPTSVIVPEESSQQVTVNFDASNLPSADSVAYIIVSSRPPPSDVDTVIVLLHSVAAPDIELSTDTLDFGTLFVGNPLTDTLEIFNSGTDTLHVLLIFSSHSDFTPAFTGVDVAPFQFQAVPVTFAPSDTGSISGSLTIAGDDPNQPVLQVELIGMGIERPVINVSPIELSDTLVSFDSSSFVLTITNTGESELTLNIGVIDVTPFAGSPTDDSLARIPFYDDFEDGDINGWLLDGNGGTADITDLTAGQGFRSFHDDSAGSGIVREFQPGFRPNQISAYVRSASNSSNDAYMDVRSSIGAPVISFHAHSNGRFFISNFGTGTTAYEDSTWYHISFRNMVWDAGRFDFYVDGRLIKESTSFGGIDIGSITIYKGGDSEEAWWDYIRIGNSIVSTDTISAVIPAGSLLDVMVKFESSNLTTGDYVSEIRISSNDSSKSPLVIPAYLHVIGFPTISVQPDSIHFDSVLIGDSDFSEITIVNTGTDTLHVIQIAIDQPEWSAFPVSFDLPPGAFQSVDIDFVAFDPGLRVATMTITSDAELEPTYEVSLVARAIIPGLIDFKGVCPADGHMYEGGSFAIQLNTHIDSGNFQSLNLLQIRKNGSPMLPAIGPTMTGLNQIPAPSSPALIMYWVASAGDAGVWEFCFEARDNLGAADTFCTEVIVEAPGADHVAWQSRHIKFNHGGGPFDIDLSFGSIHGYDTTLGIVLPFLLESASGTAFFDEAPNGNDIDLPPEYHVSFGSKSINVAKMDAVSPDSLLFGMINFGGPRLEAGGPYTTSIPSTLRDQEGIIRIDTIWLLPANQLSYNVVTNGGLLTITPTYSPGCFPVTIGPPCAVTLTGDANDSGELTSADIIWLVSYIFKGGANPIPCTATGDVTCDGSITASDVIHLVNHIFKGGSAPCDVCTLSPNTWSCP